MCTEADEQWRTVPDWPEYEVSDQGRVRSLPRIVQQRNGKFYTVAGRLLRLTTVHGYLKVTFCRNAEPSYHRVHMLVLKAFVGPKPEGMECLHEDGNPVNNRLSNLSWGTPAQNAADRIRHGTTTWGERHPLVRLTSQQVSDIRSLLAEGHSDAGLAAKFGVSKGHIGQIRTGRRWKLREEDCAVLVHGRARVYGGEGSAP